MVPRRYRRFGKEVGVAVNSCRNAPGSWEPVLGLNCTRVSILTEILGRWSSAYDGSSVPINPSQVKSTYPRVEKPFSTSNLPNTVA